MEEARMSAASVEPVTATTTAPVVPVAADITPDPTGADALGDAGKKALNEMKAERNQAKAEAAQIRAQLDALQAQIAGKETEHKAAIEAQRVRDEAAAEANKRANERILAAEIRAAAAGKLADPADALLHIKPSTFEVGEDGSTDAAAIAAAVDDLIKSKPYLAAATAPKFGSADAGVRNGAAPSLEAAIEAATKAGNHTLAISLKRQLAASKANT